MSLPNTPENVLAISDFSPGIFSALSSRIIPAPLGAAQEDGTYGCIALPGGGLGPLPEATSYINSPANFNGYVPAPAIPANGSIIPIAGIGHSYAVPMQAIVAHPVRKKYYAYNLETGTGIMGLQQWRNRAGTITNEANSNIPDTDIPYGGDMNYGRSRNATADASNLTGSHLFQGRAWLDDGGGDYDVYFEFDMSASVWTARRNFSHTGQAFLFNQRNNLMTSVSDAQFIFYDNDVGVLEGFLELDGLPGGETYGVISTGELLIVTKARGAVRIAGSLEFPSITELPGVTPTGEQSMRAVPSPVGLLYCAHKIGVMAWNGSNTSQLVSPQLRPDFFERVTDTYDSSGGQSVQAAPWGRWAVFPNNFLYDPDLNSWWRLSDRFGAVVEPCAIFWHGDRGQLYGMPDTLQPNSPAVIEWTRDTLVHVWSWKSQPIPIGTYGRMVTISDVEIRVTPSVSGVQNVQVTLTNIEGDDITETFEFNGVAGQTLRLRKGTACRVSEVVVRVVANGDAGTAPVFHDLLLTWQEAGTLSDVVI